MRRSTVAGGIFITAALAIPLTQFTPAALTGSDFEGGDGNLVVAGGTDWNSFSPTWTGTAPNRVGEATANGWQFKGLEDAAVTTSDNGFAGGTKQDDICPAVVSAKAPNKDDLRRAYVSSKTGANGHTYLNLAWARIPQNTTSPSAHVAFEFNQGLKDGDGNILPCANSSLLQRKAGDMLVVYDFEGGTEVPVIKLSRWITSGTCEVSSKTAPCWGVAASLNAAEAEARVNTGGPVVDAIGPTGSLSLGTKEFGEASIDLTEADVFPIGQCVTFGKVYAVSRTSGSSSTAQMKDLVGPGDFNLSNCGSVTINKVTENGDDDFAFTSDLPGNATFDLSNGESNAVLNVPSGGYSVSEVLTSDQVSDGWTLKSLVCSSTGSGTSTSTSAATATITLGNGGHVDCTYTNHAKLSPSIATSLDGPTNDGAIISESVGSSVKDTAALTGASSDAGGTVTYTVYSDNLCTDDYADAGVADVTAGVVGDSDPVTFNEAGTFYWQAVYSGDVNNNAATSACTDEVLTVAKKSPAGTTAQNLLPNDSFALTGGFQATGTVSFELFAPSDATCAGTPAYSESVALTGNAAATTNTDVLATAEGTWRWLVVYSGDANNNGVTLACGVEHFTIDNGD